MKRICAAILITFCCSHSAMGEIYTIEDEFDGCEHGKIYPLTNGKFMRCDSYKYFYKYRPKVVANGTDVVIDERDVRGTILDGRRIVTRLDGDWEGCDFDSHDWKMECIWFAILTSMNIRTCRSWRLSSSMGLSNRF